MNDRDKNRATGRSARMIHHAMRLADSGRAVYVLAASNVHVGQLADLATRLYPDQELPIRIETAEMLGTLDWETMTLRGAHPNCVVVADHYTIESKYRRIFDLAHAYDEPAAEVCEEDNEARPVVGDQRDLLKAIRKQNERNEL